MSQPDQEGIAIIGMAGSFGAAGVDEFWRNLVAGAESISTFSDEELAASGLDVAALKSDASYVRARGILKDAEFFDAAFFGMNPREAEVTDPQQRVFLEAAWEALENAGYAPGKCTAATGVYAGMTFNTYFLNNLHTRPDVLELVGHDAAMFGNEKDYLATRVAYKLNLKGPAINVSTACSTSLVAVGLACQSLLNFQCDMALAGGVSITFPQKRGHRFQEGAIVSPDGHTRTFDAKAQGTVFSDGVGVVVLKRVAEAIADGDQIYAVIKAVGLNNDGSAKVSFTAPSVDGHAEVIALAQAVAGFSPETISYVEAHGTATPLGDPIEIAGLTQAFRAGTDAKNFCAIGSLKTNVGHLDAAAGVAGLIKTALALKNKTLPPSLHFTEPNPAIDFASSPFFVNTALREWKASTTPRRAGVSSFGTGGTNAHAALEEAPPLELSSASRPRQLLVLSAKTASALDAATANLAAHLESNADVNLADAAFTLQVGRANFSHRRMLVCRDAADAIAALKSGDAKRLVTRRAEAAAAEVAFLFPGQGAQYAGMGCELYEREPVFRAEADRCAEILHPLLGLDIREALRGPEERLRETRIAQPALFVVGHAVAKLWMSWGIKPAAMLGHSVGEYVAGCLAGVFSLEDALRLVAARAALVQAQPAGAMLAVRLGENELAPLLGERLSIAAINSPRLCVASGPFDAVDALEALLSERGIVSRRLATSHAFHSAMMEPVIAPFIAVLDGIRLREPRIPFVSNVTARWITDAEATDPKYWAAHVRQPVRYADGVAELLREPRRALIEAGPGNTLGTLARQQAAASQVIVASFSGEDEQASMLGALGRLWLAGVEVDWSGFYKNERRHRIALPAYPFERKRFFVEPAKGLGVAVGKVLAGPHEESAAIERAAAAPEKSEVAAELNALFRELSGVADDLPANVNFLELGFDSLLLTQASLALQKRFAVKITFRQLLEELSILDDLAEFIGNAAKKAPTTRESSARADREPVATFTPAAHGPFKPIQKDHGIALTARQRGHLDALISRYEKRTAGSKQFTAVNRRHLADPRSVAGFRHLWKEITYPIVAARSAGSRIWDVDGNEYVDFIMGFGANLFGHSPEFVTKAVEAQLRLGVEIGPQTALAGEVARMICEFTGAERAAFCNTGSEAVMAALRVARTATGRSKIVTFAGDYHGVFDEVLVRPAMIGGRAGAAPIAPGIPPSAMENVIVLDYCDPKSLETLRALAPELAAVLVEPIQSRRPDLRPREFLREVRAITGQAGTPLIFDELVTGFRVHPGGAQALFGIKADIATYGKVVGGGFPIGIVAGRREYMDALDGGDWNYGDDSFPETGVTFFAGTFVRHPIALAAARAVLEHLKSSGPELQSGLSARGERLAARLAAHIGEVRAPIRVLNFGSNIYLQILPEMKFAPLLFFHLREKGIHAWENRSIILTTAHTDDDLDRLANAFRESLIEMRDAEFLQPGSPPTRTGACFALTGPQRELWLAARMNDDASRAFNDTFAISMRGSLDREKLRGALQEIVNRHDALRTTFDAEGNGQSVAPELRLDLAVTDFSQLAENERAQKLEALVASEHAKPFDLAGGPLIRAQLVHFDEAHHVLVIGSHHLVADGWSVGVLFHELKRLYAAERIEPALQYREYAEWLAAPEHAASVAAAEKFWLEKFADPPEPLELPASGARPPEKTFRAACERLAFDAEFTCALRQAAAREGCTLLAYLLATFNVWLHRLGGQRDLVVGVPAAGQIAAGALENSRALVGHCVHLLPVRTRCDGAQTFADFLAAVKRELLDASEHQDFTLGSLIEKLNLVRDASRTPLVSVTFNIDRAQSGFELRGLETEITAAPKAFNFFDVSVNVIDSDSELRVDCNFNADIFDRGTMRGWLGNWRTLIEDVIANPAKPLARAAMVSPAEKKRVLIEWNGAAREYPHDRTVHAVFEEAAARTPDAVAISDGGRRTSYAELNALANRVAADLRVRGVRSGDLVGLPAVRSTRFVAAVLGILKAGGAYVPLDANEPAERLAAMRAQCRTVLDFDAEPASADVENRADNASADGPAYVIYTSGSTGVPKGVVVPHRAINRLVVNSDYVQFRADEVVAMSSNLCFDAATFEIWGALLNGGALVVTPKEILLSPAAFQKHLAVHGVTTIFLTTSLFNQFANQAPGLFRGLRNVVFGGEAADAASVAAVLENGAPQRLVNGYGPTETTTFAVCHVIERVAGSRVPIGRPIANTQVFILDGEREPVPPGVAGEIHIGGPGVALGYHAAPELTAEKFVETEFGRVYRTGDLARWLPDGMIDYLGRADQQIKLRGFRIEPGEIETALQRHPAVRQAAVALRGEMLVAWLVRDGKSAPGEGELRDFLRQRIPAQMIPSAFVWLDALPLTANGKLDERALPEAAENPRETSGAIKPRNQVEAGIAKIWEELLSRNSFSVRDDFFAAGGHSLLAIQLIARLRQKFGVDVPVRRLFDTPTIEGVAEFIAANLPPPPPPKPLHSLIAIQRGNPEQRAIFLLPGGWGSEIEFLVYAQLKLHLGPDLPIFGLKARGFDGIETPHGSVAEMVADYVDEVRTVQPHGPYIIAGECIGGVLAYEMARRLNELGEQVDLLVLLDTERPHRGVLRQFLATERAERRRQFWEVRVRRPWQDHMENLARLGAGGKIKYLWQRATRQRSWSGGNGAAPTPLDARKVLAHYPRLLMPHRLGRYAGKVTLLIDEESYRQFENLGWDEVETGGLEVHVLPGDHLSYIRENAAAAAAKMRELINRASEVPS